MENILRRGVASLALTGLGVTPSLDQQLEFRRTTLRQGGTTEQIDGLIQAISEAAARRRKQTESGPGATRMLAAVLDAVELPRAAVPAPSSERKRVSVADASTDFEPLVKELLGLVGEALSRSEDPPKTRALLLNKLFSRSGDDSPITPTRPSRASRQKCCCPAG